MKCRYLILLLSGLLACPAMVRGQALSTDAEKKARDLLRDVVESRERAKNPGKQIPAPSVAQPAPPTVMTSAPPVLPTKPPIIMKLAPAVTSPGPAPVAGIPAPPVAAPPLVSAPAPDKLAPTGLRPSRQLNYAELEQRYLSGQITARQFQQYLHDRHVDLGNPQQGSNRPLPPVYTKERPPTAATPVPERAKPGPSQAPEVVTAPAPTAPEPETKPEVTPQRPTEQSDLSEVERKMDELLRLKAAREQAAATAALTKTNHVESSAPKTKRQRMDQLLQLFISGKLTEAEYKARREQLLAEPEPK